MVTASTRRILKMLSTDNVDHQTLKGPRNKQPVLFKFYSVT